MALFGKDKKTSTQTKAAPAGSMQDLYKDEATNKSDHKVGKTKVSHAEAARVLVRPLITEKATNLATTGKYVFVVSKGANKISVARAVATIYGVKPQAVNILNMEGKRVSRGRIQGQRSDWRKAIVTLKPGETIKIYEGV
jgi:large subunit ribosomal protein L23